jgi:hypothetical protein
MITRLSLAVFHFGLPILGAADPPPMPGEFRGVWVATVGRIDWPSKKGPPAAAIALSSVSMVTNARRPRSLPTR